MHPIQEIAQHLHNNGIGQLGDDLFYGYAPDKPAAITAIMDTGGQAPSRDIPTKNPTFQVFIRALTYAEGKGRLEAIRSLLHQKRNTQLVPDGTYFYYIYALAEGGHLGRDDEQNDLFSINFATETR